MSSPGTQDRLPIIDIAPFLDSDAKNTELRATTAKALHSACIEYGFFYLNIEAYVDPSEPEELALLARQFFSLPQAEKDQLSIKNQDYARGYNKLKENITNGKSDIHEALDFYKPVENPDKTKPIWGENQWPSIPGFKNKFDQWVEKMKILGFILMEAMAEGLGMTKEEWRELRSQVDDSFWVMRVIGYPPLPNDHDGYSCGSHRDYGCLTFLWADPTPSALQIYLNRPGESQSDITGLPLEKDSKQGIWIDANPIPGCVVCNIGEMWEIWTNGLYRSTLHRVIHRGSNYRLSIPFFFEPNFDAVVRPLTVVSRLNDEEPGKKSEVGPLRRPVVYGDFLWSKVKNNFDLTGKGKYD